MELGAGRDGLDDHEHGGGGGPRERRRAGARESQERLRDRSGGEVAAGAEAEQSEVARARGVVGPEERAQRSWAGHGGGRSEHDGRAGEDQAHARDSHREAPMVRLGVEPREVRQERARDPGEEEDRNAYEHGRGEHHGRRLGRILAASDDHEQRRAVDKQLVGAGDHARGRGKPKGRPKPEALARRAALERGDLRPRPPQRQHRAANPSRRQRCRGDVLRGEREQRQREDEPHHAVADVDPA